MRLADGDALLIGGVPDNGPSLATTERYDVATNRWSPGATLAQARAHGAAATLLGGRVLAIGGQDAAFSHLTSAEL